MPASFHLLANDTNADLHVAAEGGKAKTRVIDLDVDIGADAVDYKWV